MHWRLTVASRRTRLHVNDQGQVWGNVIVTRDGKQHPLDHHSAGTFKDRVKNFVVGGDPVVLTSDKEVQAGRDQSLQKLSNILGKRGNRMIDIIGRASKLNEDQVKELLSWLRGIMDSAPRS
jgi:hypothetical protein